MPIPNPGENETDFLSRCIGMVMEEGTANDKSQAAAICHSIWKRKKQENTEGAALSDLHELNPYE